MKAKPKTLNPSEREVVGAAVVEVCENRGYTLHAINVRRNHFHVVVSAAEKPEVIAKAFKSYATRKLRRHHLIGWNERPWSRGSSRRYLWKDNHVSAAIDYVLYSQDDPPFEKWSSFRQKRGR